MNYDKRKITGVVIKPNLGLVVSHEGPRDRKANSKDKEQISAEPEKDFTKAMRILRAALVRTSAAGHFEAALRQPALEGVLKSAMLTTTEKECRSFMNKAVTMTKAVFKYDGDNLSSVKLYGNFVNAKGVEMEINSPQIELNGEPLYGFEAQLREQCEAVIEEVKSYLKGNYTRLEVEPEEEPAEKKPEEKKADDKEETEEEKVGKTKLPNLRMVANG